MSRHIPLHLNLIPTLVRQLEPSLSQKDFFGWRNNNISLMRRIHNLMPTDNVTLYLKDTLARSMYGYEVKGWYHWYVPPTCFFSDGAGNMSIIEYYD